MLLRPLVEDGQCTDCGVHGRIDWTNKSSREARQEGMCRVCHATVFRCRGAANTQWSDQTAWVTDMC